MKKALFYALAMLFSISVNAQCPINASLSIANTPSGPNLLRYTMTSTSTFGSAGNYKVYINYGDGMSYSYNWSTSITDARTHSYANPGTYTIKYAVSKIDSPIATVLCTDTFTTSLNVAYTSCASYFNVTNLSSPSNKLFTAVTPMGTSNLDYFWNFGDGNSIQTTSNVVSHQYLNNGNHTVTLTVVDSSNMCTSTSQVTTIVTNAPVSRIHGYVETDSAVMISPDIRVWLITYDSTTQELSAIDSVTLFGASSNAYYQFLSVPDNPFYRVKAHVLNGPTSGSGYVPTYHDSVLFWNAVPQLYHWVGQSTIANIYMRTGTVTTGPGFIGGNVTLGANRGTSAGIPDVDIYLMSGGKLIARTVTDVNGNYGFSSLPVGAYSVIPEVGAYTTTPYVITLATGQTSVQAANFELGEISKTIVPVTTGISTVAAGSSISIYPNPASNRVEIRMDAATKDTTIVIADIVGRTAYKNTTTVQDGKVILDLSSLQSGQYFISVTTDGNTVTEKLILRK